MSTIRHIHRSCTCSTRSRYALFRHHEYAPQKRSCVVHRYIAYAIRMNICSTQYVPHSCVRDWKGAVGGLFFAHAKKRRYPCKARPCRSVYRAATQIVPRRAQRRAGVVTGCTVVTMARERQNNNNYACTFFYLMLQCSISQ